MLMSSTVKTLTFPKDHKICNCFNLNHLKRQQVCVENTWNNFIFYFQNESAVGNAIQLLKKRKCLKCVKNFFVECQGDKFRTTTSPRYLALKDPLVIEMMRM